MPARNRLCSAIQLLLLLLLLLHHRRGLLNWLRRLPEATKAGLLRRLWRWPPVWKPVRRDNEISAMLRCMPSLHGQSLPKESTTQGYKCKPGGHCALTCWYRCSAAAWHCASPGSVPSCPCVRRLAAEASLQAAVDTTAARAVRSVAATGASVAGWSEKGCAMQMGAVLPAAVEAAAKAASRRRQAVAVATVALAL